MSFVKSRSVKDQLQMIDRHIKLGNTKLVNEAIAGICSRPTLKNLLADFDAAETATTVKNGNLKKIVGRLPDLDYEQYVNTYRFFLQEMNIVEESQKALFPLQGSYNLYSNIPTEQVEMKGLALIANNNSRFPAFFCRLGFPDSDQTYELCDGFLFTTGNKLILSGLSECASMFMVFKRPPTKKINLMDGFLTLENKFSNKSFFSSAILQNRNFSTLTAGEVQNKVGKTFQTL